MTSCLPRAVPAGRYRVEEDTDSVGRNGQTGESEAEEKPAPVGWIAAFAQAGTAAIVYELVTLAAELPFFLN